MLCGNGANVNHTMENLILPLVLLLVLILVVYLKRQKIKELRNKYGNVLRDMLRIVTINFLYAQINSLLPLVLTVRPTFGRVRNVQDIHSSQQRSFDVWVFSTAVLSTGKWRRVGCPLFSSLLAFLAVAWVLLAFGGVAVPV
jgi:ABC-type iron transport system FetAB permease component